MTTRFVAALGLLVTCATLARAQGSQPAATPPAAPPFTFSGVILGNYQYHTENAGTPNANFNKFDIERAYLTFAGPAGENGSFRVTTDVFQNTSPTNSAYYAGWVVRLKYAYFQYDFLKTPDWGLFARAGIVQNAIIDFEENYWPRWISPTPMDRGGWMPSADAGIAAQLTLPDKFGALYGTITNGPGYGSREVDRFKDFAARLAITPFAANKDMPFLNGFVVAPWVYKGALASKFAQGGTGQVGAIGSASARDRWGVFAALKHPAFTIGGDWAERRDGFEAGANTVVSPRIYTDSTGRLLSGYIVAKPALFFGGKSSPLGVLARYDQITPVSASAPKYHVAIAGLTYDLTNRIGVSLDYQEDLPENGLNRAPQKIYFSHFVVNF